MIRRWSAFDVRFAPELGSEHRKVVGDGRLDFNARPVLWHVEENVSRFSDEPDGAAISCEIRRGCEQ